PLTEDYPAYAALTVSELAPYKAQIRNLKPVLIQVPPTTCAVTYGETNQLLVNANYIATYQWQKNGKNIEGATSNILSISGANSLSSGKYTCIITNNEGISVTTEPCVVEVEFNKTLRKLERNNAETNYAARLTAISTRSLVKNGDSVQIAGFVIKNETGFKNNNDFTKDAKVLVRASGPSLSKAGITGTLPNPTMAVYKAGQNDCVRNDDWDYNTIHETATNLGAGALDRGSKDAAMLLDLPFTQSGQVSYQNAGETIAYTTVVLDNNPDKEGVALIEVYDAGAEVNGLTNPRMKAISTRSWVDRGENSQIAGFVIAPDPRIKTDDWKLEQSLTKDIMGNTKFVLVRAVGPQLIDSGVANALPDPTITVYNSKGEAIATNDNWGEGVHSFQMIREFQHVGAGPFAEGSKDAALILNLPPGAYTAIVTPKDNTPAGVGLVEVYEVY
nr:hypothetical protein [Opitutaceae bacterium]